MKFGLIDRTFAVAEKHPKKLAACAVALAAGALTFEKELNFILSPHEQLFKLVALVISPLVTLLSFYLNYRGKVELIHSTTQATLLKAEAKSLQDEAASSKRQADASFQQLETTRSELKGQQVQMLVKEHEMNQLQREMAARETLIKSQRQQLEQLAAGAEDLWQGRAKHPFPEYDNWFNDCSGATIVAVGNLKGGVGKSTFASLLAAFASQHMKKGVLVVDLDFQGSLSSLLMLGVGSREAESRAERLLLDGDALEVITRERIALDGKFTRGWLIPSNYTFAQAENSLLFKYVIEQGDGIDHRYRLAQKLLDPRVRNQFDLIILDTPPRLTLGTVNALVAAHYLIVPTILDKLSVDPIHRFLRQVGAIRTDLGLSIQFGGIVGMMTRVHPLREGSSAAEVWKDLSNIDSVWGEEDDFRLGIVPRRDAIANAVGEAIAYFSDGGVRDVFNPIARRILERMTVPVDTDMG